MILVLNKVLGNYLINSFSEKAFMSGLESEIKLKSWENDFSSSLKCPFLVAFEKQCCLWIMVILPICP